MNSSSNRQVPGARPSPFGGGNSPISQRSTSSPMSNTNSLSRPGLGRPTNGQIWGQPPSTAKPASFAQAVSNSTNLAAASSPGSNLPNSSSSVAPGGSGQPTSLDINDFPALGSGGSTIPQRNQSPTASAEDFPALPGSSKSMPPQQPAQYPHPPPHHANVSTPPPPPSQQQEEDTTNSGGDLNKYGMNGLMGVIRMENNDQTTVAIGNDLTTLGLDFNPTNEPLSRTFASPWVETSKYKPEPEFKLPECYDVPSAVPQQQKIQNFTDETLFYIFYTMPRDTMQEAASIELTNRNWRFHKELKLWLTKDPFREPVPQTQQSEKGQYIFFDPASWSKVKKEYVLYYPDIA